jgi:hypothetical protein
VGCWFVGCLVGWLVGELEDCCGSVVVSCCSVKLVAEAGDSSGTQCGGGNSAVGSRYQTTAIEECNRLRRHVVSYSDL